MIYSFKFFITVVHFIILLMVVDHVPEITDQNVWNIMYVPDILLDTKLSWPTPKEILHEDMYV